MTEKNPPEMTEGDITRLLIAWSGGDLHALDDLFPLAYQDLRRVARRCSAQIPSQDLQPTELIGSIYFTLRKQKRVRWDCRAQFYRFAALLMERVLIDHRRELRTQKRGGRTVRVSLLEAFDVPAAADGTSLAPESSVAGSSGGGTGFEDAVSQAVDVAEKIAELEELDPLQAEIARLRYLIGLTVPQTAEILGVTEVTVKGKWRHAKRFLGLELGDYGPKNGAADREDEDDEGPGG
jgi:RNA polymerase sigma factor (sigma-70 family)